MVRVRKREKPWKMRKVLNWFSVNQWNSNSKYIKLKKSFKVSLVKKLIFIYSRYRVTNFKIFKLCFQKFYKLR